MMPLIRDAFLHLNFFTKKGYTGIVWYLFDSMVLFSIFIFLRHVVSFATIAQYPLYLLIGISMFNFFRKATTQPINCVKKKPGEMRTFRECAEKTVVPVIHTMFLHCIELCFIVALLFYFDVSILGIIFYALFFMIVSVLYWLIASTLLFMNYRWDNTRQAWMSFLRLLFIATPVFYVVPDTALLPQLSPLYHIVFIGRKLLLEPNTFFQFFVLLCIVLFLGLVFYQLSPKQQK